MKIAVLGGYGAMGRNIVRDLEENIPEVDEILLGDIRDKEAEHYVKQIGAKKTIVKYINIKEHEKLVREISDCDAVVNACLYDTVVDVTKAAIEARVNLTDLGGLYYYILEQLKLHEEARDAGITVIPGMGSSPGISNVLCRLAASQMDKIKELAVKFAGVQVGATAKRRLPIPWAIESIINELGGLEPLVYENGEMKKLPPGSGEGPVEFSPPIGTVKGYYTIHSELATIPKTINPDKFYIQGAFARSLEEPIRMLINLGFASLDPIEVKGVTVVPRDVMCYILTHPPPEEGATMGTFYSGIKVEAIGERKGKKIRLEYETQGSMYEKWGITSTALRTAVAASVCAWMLARGDIKNKGILPPEVSIDPTKFLSELRKRDIIIYEKRTIEL